MCMKTYCHRFMMLSLNFILQGSSVSVVAVTIVISFLFTSTEKKILNIKIDQIVFLRP